jgi:cob(I)alamin adenosyltransferase
MEKSKIYTGRGDGGFTSLVGGKREPKSSIRIESYGSIDELNSFIACLIEEIDERSDREFLFAVQSELFTLGSYLATEAGVSKCLIDTEAIDRIELEIDRTDHLLPPIKNFILPGGCRANALSNICRTVCRRAERAIYQLNNSEKVDSEALKYINRLSDYFFVLGRKYNLLKNIDEISWKKPC